ncbi:hypothetical protein E4T38_06636 [Aureobasidium subglaciale]|nr:hypothetical protein E4T38_06636 [Aureobasidium subglaciale]KAI5218066.1 hypothetical protein E4T40_07093 [Aureobasidium subglaciale]KAI5221641.1 hypothetical protein E4T41_07013 [Aureobasidium subglaciale]KAI5259096.1 hypothetical protein E4T46_06991 [Aureobasidium subglaciale]
MPPTSSVRKASVATTDTNNGRRQSARQPRTSTARPINYYARSFGQHSNNHDNQDPDPPGFFPAVQYFADSIAALPREVQRHITLMKEVEAKVYGPTEALKFLTSSILNKPAPLSRNQPSSPRLLSFTAPPSATASLAGSVINGNQPATFDQRVQDDLESQQDEQADHARRSEFQSLRHVIGNMITNLDEKNVVMAEANRALAQQLARLDSVMPEIENEISEESRLGSLTHWAYQDNRAKKQTATTQNERNRRDVAATSSLAAAAAAVHDQDIAAARGEARRETKKTNRGQPVDSDFDDRPTKRAQTGKSRKNADTEPKASGLGIANGVANAATTKRRKVEKVPAVAGAPAMERSASNMSTVAKAARGAANTTPRSTPAVETIKKKGKPGPAPGTGAGKKRNPALNQSTNSPRLNNSSPVLGHAQLQPETLSRPASSRMRQNSNSTSNLQHSLLPDQQVSRPASVADNRSVNGSTNGQLESHMPPLSSSKVAKQSVEEVEEGAMMVDEPEHNRHRHRPEPLKDEDVTMEDAGLDVRPGRGSVTCTPRTEAFPDVAVSRTRGRLLHNGHSRGSGTPDHSRSAHDRDRKSRGRRKSGSGAHILKQIASFNRSPDADRRRDDSKGSDMSDDDGHGRSIRRSQPPRVTTISRNRRERVDGSRGTTSSRRTELSPEAEYEAPEADAEAEVEAEAEADEVEQVVDDEEIEEAEDPDEPKYCYCGQGSFGEMIACDNDDCPMEWFHLGCTGLRAVPGDNGEYPDRLGLMQKLTKFSVKWFCDVCKEPKGKKAKMMANRH